MRAEEHSSRTLEVDGWQVTLVSYRLEGIYHCTADNVSPGAWLARAIGDSRQEAEDKALDRARQLLARTKRREAP